MSHCELKCRIKKSEARIKELEQKLEQTILALSNSMDRISSLESIISKNSSGHVFVKSGGGPYFSFIAGKELSDPKFTLDVTKNGVVTSCFKQLPAKCFGDPSPLMVSQPEKKGLCLDDTTTGKDPATDPYFQNLTNITWPGSAKDPKNNIAFFRSYHYRNDNEKKWVDAVIAKGIPIMVGIDNQKDFDSFYSIHSGVVAGGNKILAIAITGDYPTTPVAGIPQDWPSTLKYITDTAVYIKNKNREIKIACCLSYSDVWVGSDYPPGNASAQPQFKDLLNLENLDVVCFNLYGAYFNSKYGTEWAAESVTLNQFNAIATAINKYYFDPNMSRKDFWVSEIGWGKKTPGIEKFYNNFLGYASSTKEIEGYPTRFFYFSARDYDNGSGDKYGILPST